MSDTSDPPRPRLLVVEDDPGIRRALAINLGAAGFEVEEAGTGERALELVGRMRPDGIILDLGLPGIGGIEVINGVRGWSQVPILVLSVRSDEGDKVDALEAGADDYVTKPFGIAELVARLRALLRRASDGEPDPIVETESFTVDLPARRVRREDTEVHLTPTEWSLLEALVRNPDRLLSQRQLLQTVWGPQYGDESNYLRVYMGQLRRKLERDPARPRHLITEPGVGYRFLP
jgi:two-component system KDP operon response regulator KdpE